MKRIAWLVVMLALHGWASAEPSSLEIQFVSVPPNVAVAVGGTRLELAGKQPQPVVLPTSLRPSGGNLVFELSYPGYDPLPVEISADQLPPGGSLRLPLQDGQFYHLQPSTVSVTFLSQPAEARVDLELDGTNEVLGRAGEPIELNLAGVLERSQEGQVAFRLELMGYRSEPVTVRVDELREGARLGPFRMKPAFPGAPWFGWLAGRPVVTAGLLVLCLLAAGLIWKRRRR